MFTVNRKQTRPNDATSFDGAPQTPEFVAYFERTYIATGKFLGVEYEHVPGSLEMTTVHKWASEADFDQHNLDPMCISVVANRDALEETAGISAVQTKE